jgi:putative ABC transport system ATP-binding protein
MYNIIKIKNLVKTYEQGRVRTLDGLNLEVKKGEFIAIQGPSGSGKSTLLHMIGALDQPTSGQLFVCGIDLTKVRNLDEFRSKKIGFVFQLHNLIPSLTTLENVLIPMFEMKLPKKEKINKAKEILRLVGLEKRLNYVPPKLSGGERGRVAIARALANDPEIILADEPTGDVDSKTGDKIIHLLRDINKKKGTTLVVVTHDPVIAEHAPRVLRLVDGKIV